ncbi:phosphoribosylformimino-5-aminoimidazole carboxamide ribotide isomerase [Desulfotalea psychrophila]|uniref:Probable phosphoribosylformimino-5-aminoimidazole carboxamide ribotide isomerase n=1 Tax=Desulfotalea psychrophila (strain LSv54 / DSM 12343) TaxID=177439 RepID=Q6ASC9_DESPS|nr:phosphoribosylformimino-5-aminoimidazole carboxamide ribotide isomerase [Desulfotalea psychrophila]CAG34734.1 probable phosphoribosylformimino-5-aminoimidazole carboxamide ribotide isomerase [Desulfotalea psychrophila LSv54]
MKFRPCIDLHNGQVKQIVGSTLSDVEPSQLQTNYTADKPASWFANLYRQDDLRGGHIIKLGPGNDDAAKSALAAWPGGMQIGGGINYDNACDWLDLGASHVIVTSWVFSNGQIDEGRLADLVRRVGKKRLVLDLSCRRRGDDYFIVTDRWQKFTEVQVVPEVLERLASCCDEFLLHAADVEGKCEGIERDLVLKLADWSPIATTYAGGIRGVEDLQAIAELGRGRIDATIGSALDIFGGSLISYAEAVEFHKRNDL